MSIALFFVRPFFMSPHIPDLHRDLLDAAERQTASRTATAPVKRRRQGLFVTGLAAAMIATGLAVGTSDDPTRSNAPETLQAEFAVFRRAAATTPPSGERTTAPTTFDDLVGAFERGSRGRTVDADAARQLQVPNALVVAVPATRTDGTPETCLLVSSQYNDGGSASGCEPLYRVKRDGMFSYTDVDDALARRMQIPTGSFTVDGLVPDGAQDVSVHLADGRTVPVKVTESAMSTTVSSRPTMVTFTNSDGPHRVALQGGR